MAQDQASYLCLPAWNADGHFLAGRVHECNSPVLTSSVAACVPTSATTGLQWLFDPVDSNLLRTTLLCKTCCFPLQGSLKIDDSPDQNFLNQCLAIHSFTAKLNYHTKMIDNKNAYQIMQNKSFNTKWNCNSGH